MDTTKAVIYWIMVLSYGGAASIEFYGRHWKPGILAVGFGVLNALIFLWKPTGS